MARKNTARIWSALADCFVIWPTPKEKESSNYGIHYYWNKDSKALREDWNKVGRDLKTVTWRWDVDHGLVKHDAATKAHASDRIIKRSHIVGRAESGSRRDRWIAREAADPDTSNK